jgi:hypothetical protein
MTRPSYIDNDKREELYREATKPVVCRSLNDIRAALEPFTRDSPGEEVTVTCELSEQVDNKYIKYNTVGKSKNISLKQTLFDGLMVVKKRLETMDKMQAAIDHAKDSDKNFSTSLQAWDVDRVRFNVDALIERKLGARRKGILIRWELLDGVFEYDVFSGKLYKIT